MTVIYFVSNLALPFDLYTILLLISNVASQEFFIIESEINWALKLTYRSNVRGNRRDSGVTY